MAAHWIFDDAVMLYGIYQSDEERLLQKYMNNYKLDRKAAVSLLNSVKSAIQENQARRSFVVSYMHYTGENYGKLDSKQMWKVYCQADGFGYQRASELRKINGGWDWSHIRDSTIDGWKRMEKTLNKFGFYI